ncbi:hypothetical protein NL676_003839, partial [Syzygium grande]
MVSVRDNGDVNQPLLGQMENDRQDRVDCRYAKEEEEEKLGTRIAGPAIFTRVAMSSMDVITQAFAGHLGEVDLAAMMIASATIVGFNVGLLVGMASALDTLCGQAFSAKRYHKLGIYMQRSWIVLFLCCLPSLPIYISAMPLLKLLGQADDVAKLSCMLALWLIPLHVSFALMYPLINFLQSQRKMAVTAWVSLAGLVGLCVAWDLSWWLMFFGLFLYSARGGSPLTWIRWSVEAFLGLWDFFKLSLASGVMLWNVSSSLTIFKTLL